MADVTISSLPLGTPSSSALLPYSQGGSTLAVSPSGIVAASPGSVLQVVYGQDNNEYNFPSPGNTTAPYNYTSSLTINKKLINSKLIIDVSAYGLGYRNTTVPGWGLFLFYEGASIVNRYPYLHMSTSYVDFITGTLNVLAQHTPPVINPTYSLAIQKASAAGTGTIIQYSSYWTITEVAM